MKYLYLILILFLPISVYCQQVKGRVNSTTGDPLSGISITVKGTNIKTTTTAQGQFSIDIPSQNSILLFSRIGYQQTEVPARLDVEMYIRMEEEVSVLDEVQVIAYGTTTKRYNLGSVTSVKSADIEKQPVTNPLAALQGRVPGLVVTGTSGLPGSKFNLQIRGQNTLASTPQGVGGVGLPLDNPLFIVDGVPFSPQNTNINQMASAQSPGTGVSYNNPYGGFSPFNSINPSDIESIEVLRDADATAIYGSRGGNGVVLITTKKGKTGKTAVQLDFSNGISMIGKTMRMMETEEYLEMRREALSNGNLTPNLTPGNEAYAPDLLLFEQDKYTDWKNYFLDNTAHNTALNTSISGGANKTQFRIGAGFNRNTYNFPGDYADNRANVLVNLNHTSNDDKFSISLASNYSYNKNNSSGSRDILAAYILEPNYPNLVDEKGDLVWTYKGIPLGTGGVRNNPLTYLKNNYHIQNSNLTSNLQLSYELMKGLVARSSFGFNSFYSNEYFGNPKSAQNPVFNTQATASFGKNNFTTWIIEPQLEYNKTVALHRFNLLLGGTVQRNSNDRILMTGTGYTNDDLIESISSATTKNVTDGFSEYKYAALFARLNYRFDDKYLINFTARRDGSSRFGPGKQFGNFGSIGLGWLFSEEDFIKNLIPSLSHGKLRGSYGVTGSDATSDYQYLSRWAVANYLYNGASGYLPQNLFNPVLGWASTQKAEAGLELGFIRDRILLNATYYRNRSGNQLVTYTLPSITGFSNVATNWDAVIQNTGLELMLQSINLKSDQGLNWSSSFNITFPKNKLITFPGIETSTYNLIYEIGQSTNTVFGYKYAGVNEETGLFQFYDSEGNKTSTPKTASSGEFNDFQNLGNLDPKFYGGFLNSFTFKKFQLDIFFEYKKQMGINYLKQVYAYTPGFEMNLPATLLDRWKSPGDQAEFQKLTTQYGDAYTTGRNFSLSSGVYSDASYIRLKNIALSYSFGEVLKSKVNNLRLFCNAQNLLTFTNYLGNDPETQSFYGVPTLRTVVLGLQLTL